MRNTLNTILHEAKDKPKAFNELVESFRFPIDVSLENPYNKGRLGVSYGIHLHHADFDSIGWQYSSFKDWLKDGLTFVALEQGIDDRIDGAIQKYNDKMSGFFALITGKHLGIRKKMLQEFQIPNILKAIREVVNPTSVNYNELRQRHKTMVEQGIMPFEMELNVPRIRGDHIGEELLEEYEHGLEEFRTRLVDETIPAFYSTDLSYRLPKGFKDLDLNPLILGYSIKPERNAIVESLRTASNRILDDEKNKMEIALSDGISKSMIADIMTSSSYAPHEKYGDRLRKDFRAYVLRVGVAMDVNDLRIDQVKEMIKSEYQ